MNWSEYLLDERFVGRQPELEVLARELLSPEHKIVAITGIPGTGKTALARAFAHVHRDAFPGGIYHVHATPLESIEQTVAAHVSTPSTPYLLILDDLHVRPPREQYLEISGLRDQRPSARLICISGGHGWSGTAALTLELGNLSRAEMEELAERLQLSFADGTAAELFKATGGNPLAARLFGDLLSSGARTPRELWQYLHSFSHSGLVGVDGRPIASGAREERQIIVDVSSINDDLLRRVYAEPTLLHAVTPRRFEEFVAELLDRLGYEVTLTPASNDGGTDIYAAKKDDLGSFLYVVECKKYAPDRPVGVGLIRQLNGVVQAERATAGVLATTSFFTRGARELQARLSNQISLKDYVGIQEWLEKVFTRDA